MEEPSTTSTDITDSGSVVAADLAAEDFGGTVLGGSIHIVVGDHLVTSDLASIVATRGLDHDCFGAIFDVAIALVALAIQFVGKRRPPTSARRAFQAKCVLADRVSVNLERSLRSLVTSLFIQVESLADTKVNGIALHRLTVSGPMNRPRRRNALNAPC
jgi:hypothetical protein